MSGWFTRGRVTSAAVVAAAALAIGGTAAALTASPSAHVVSRVAGGTVLTPPGWATATSRFDIDAISGFSRLTVSRWSQVGS